VQLSDGLEFTEHSRNEPGNDRVDMWLAPTDRQDAMSDLGFGRVKRFAYGPGLGAATRAAFSSPGYARIATPVAEYPRCSSPG
jgi:hypothetical protein